GLMPRCGTSPERLLMTFSSRPPSSPSDQTRSVLSRPAETSWALGVYETEVTAPEWPGMWYLSSPLAVSHRAMSRSSLPVAKVVPSGLNAMQFPEPRRLPGIVLIGSLESLLRSKMRMLPSMQPDTHRFCLAPAGLQATDVTATGCG